MWETFLSPDNLTYMLKGAGASLALALGALIFGVMIGVVMAAMKLSKSKVLNVIGSVYVEILRGTPMLLQVLFFYLGVPVLYQMIAGTRLRVDPYVVGLIAMSLNSGAYQTELIRSGIQGVDKGQWEACETLGISYVTMMKEVILPQAFKRIIPPMVSEFITLIKDSSLISCIGAAELAACRYFEPELYEAIVSPVRHAAGVAVDTGRAGLNAAAQFCRDTADAAGQLNQNEADGLSRFAEETAERWAELTAPKDHLEKYRPPSQEDPAVPTPSPITELRREGDRELLTGGSVDIVYYCQSAPQWADQPYGTDTIGPYGCGPTVMAMAVASLTDEAADPVSMAAWAVSNGHWARKGGSRHSIIQGAAAGFGIEAQPFPSREAADVRDALRQGKLLVALVGPGHFTKGGHFIVLRGVTLSGKILVADPNSQERSLMEWEPELILEELSRSTSDGAPLWVISQNPPYSG